MSGVKGRSGPRKKLGTQINEAMALLDKELPGLIQKLIDKAEKGDRDSLIYLIDRRMGKPRATVELEGAKEIGANLLVKIARAVIEKRRELEGIKDGQSVTEGKDQSACKALQREGE